MEDQLRQIAIHVEEPTPGSFCWVLSERTGAGHWEELDRGTKRTKTFKKAMSDGLVAYEGLIDDLDVGPRHAATAGATAQVKTDVREPEKKPAKTAIGMLFGFGPVR